MFGFVTRLLTRLMSLIVNLLRIKSIVEAFVRIRSVEASVLSELIKCFFSKTLASLQLCISLIVTLAFILYSLFYNGYMPSKVRLDGNIDPNGLILAAPWSDDGCWVLRMYWQTWHLQQHQSVCQHPASSSQPGTKIQDW